MPSPSPVPFPADNDAYQPIERVVLLGFMCSGKSTVGNALARRLEWGFLDFDVEIELREGQTVADVIASRGEEYFRGAEAALTAEVVSVHGLVLAPGGAWITQPSLLQALGPGTLSVWLQVSPDETIRRLRSDDIARPLRDHPDPSELIVAMLREREPLYQLADLAVVADGRSAEDVAFEIERFVRGREFYRSSSSSRISSNS